jgi:hypothetical protein
LVEKWISAFLFTAGCAGWMLAIIALILWGTHHSSPVALIGAFVLFCAAGATAVVAIT